MGANFEQTIARINISKHCNLPSVGLYSHMIVGNGSGVREERQGGHYCAFKSDDDDEFHILPVPLL